MTNKAKIESLVDKYFDKIQSIRHHLHQYPELSFQEYETSKFIKSILDENDIDYTDGWAKTGILAKIKGKSSQKCIALRADIDALPIQENSKKSYCSKNEGKMHACGHDVHTACVLGSILILNEIKDQLKYDVIFVFQPGEEKLPGGASLILEEGIFDQQKPDIIIGQHVHPPMKVGNVGVKGGMYMASADELYITVKGQGGHAALPHQCVDPILIASKIIINLQDITSRMGNPTIPNVLTIGKINSTGGATNIIPNEVKLEGTLRTMDEQWRKKAHELIQKICQQTAQSYGGSCEVEILKGYPFLKNDEVLTTKVKSLMQNYLGSDQVEDLPIRMTAEDFAYYSQRYPACFYRLGTGNPDLGITSPVHTNTFDIDENALRTGSGLLAFLASNIEVN